MIHLDLINKIRVLYEKENPSFKTVLDLLEKHDENIIVDHISFRTFDFPTISIDALAVPFIEAGYQEEKRYKYENQEVKARHYAHKTDKSAPLIFFSEISTYKFSKSLQSVVKNIVERIPINILCSEKIFLTPTPWKSIHYSIYEQLKSESEYAAGIYANGFLAHHIGILINSFEKYYSINKLSSFLKENNIPYTLKNHSQQSHIIALIEQLMLEMKSKKKTFVEGEYEIPTSSPEFTRRNYMANNKLFMEFLPNLTVQKPEPMTLEQINQLILEDS